MRIDETYFAGYHALVLVAISIAGLCALLGMSLGIASVVKPGLRARLKDAVKPVLIGIVFFAVVFALLRLFDSREYTGFGFGIALLILLGARLSDGFLSGLAATVLSYALAALALFFLVAYVSASSIGNTVYYALPIIVGVILLRSSYLFEASSHKRFAPAVFALGLLVAGGNMWVMFSTLAEDWGIWFDLANAFTGGIIAIGLARFVFYGEEAGSPFMEAVCDFARRSQFKIFIVGAVLGLYFALIRPAIADSVSFAPLLEWGVVCLAVWYVYRSSRVRIEAHSSSAFFPVWEKFTPEMERVLDEDFAYISLIQQDFVERGQKDGLVVYLSTLLNKMGMIQARISKLLHPLIAYEDVRSPWYPFNWNQSGIVERNQQARGKVLGDVIASLKEAAKEETKEQQISRRRRKYERLRHRAG